MRKEPPRRSAATPAMQGCRHAWTSVKNVMDILQERRHYATPSMLHGAKVILYSGIAPCQTRSMKVQGIRLLSPSAGVIQTWSCRRTCIVTSCDPMQASRLTNANRFLSGSTALRYRKPAWGSKAGAPLLRAALLKAASTDHHKAGRKTKAMQQAAWPGARMTAKQRARLCMTSDVPMTPCETALISQRLAGQARLGSDASATMNVRAQRRV